MAVSFRSFQHRLLANFFCLLRNKQVLLEKHTCMCTKQTQIFHENAVVCFSLVKPKKWDVNLK